MISEDRIERAVDYLRDSAPEIAHARSEMVRTEKMLHHVRAIAMSHSEATSAAAREQDAYASEAYQGAIDAHADAVLKYEEMRATREAATMLIEAWRSMSANYRGIKL